MLARTILIISSVCMSSIAFAGKRCGEQGSWKSQVVPDQWGVARFFDACSKHDDCYSTVGADRGQCDKNFRTDLEKECASAYLPEFGGALGGIIDAGVKAGSPAYHSCIAAAQTYAAFVRNQGQKAYADGQAHPVFGKNPRSQSGVYMLHGGHIIFSNGANAFCHFWSPLHFNMTSGKWDEARSNPISTENLSGLADHGACKVQKIPAGFFGQVGRNEVWWSNGENAFCYIPHPKYITGPVTRYDFDIVGNTSFRQDSTCPGM